MRTDRLGRSDGVDGTTSDGRSVQIPRRRNQRGSALMMLMAIVVFMTLVGLALATFADANLRATKAFNNARTTRYNADAAIKSATNWIATNDDVAVDPLYKPDANEDCRHYSTAADGTIVTVSCFTEAGSDAGIPPDQGILPPEGLLLLGDRHNEPGPYSQVRCRSVIDDIKAFFSGGTNNGMPEAALLGKKRQQAGWGNFLPCSTRSRGSSPIRVSGDITIAGKLKLADNLKLLVEGGDGGAIKVRYGCDMPEGSIVQKAANWATTKGTVAIPNAQVPCNVAASTLRTADPDDPMPWDGSHIFSDPGRKSSVTGANGTQPIGDIQPQFLPIGFADDGGLKPGYSLPERTTAYVYNQAAWNALSPKPVNVPEGLVPLPTPLDGSGQCSIERGTPVIFLWGWYRSSEVLNRYTAEKKCPDQTFWFAPDPGADGKLLTVDDKTAPFYLDFTQTSSTILAKSKCGGMAAENAARWCLGGADRILASKPRVVVGWPNEWTAMPTAEPTGGDDGDTNTGYGSRVGAYLDTANSIEGNFLSYWTNTDAAKRIDSSFATYRPCTIPILWWVVRCPSLGNRSLRMAQFSPKVAGGPIAEPTMAEPAKTHGLMKVDVAFAMRNAGSLVPKITVDRLNLDNDSVETCGTYDLVLSTPSLGYSVETNFDPTNPFPAESIATITPEDQAALARDCGAVDQINNLRINFQVDGNWTNSGIPEFFLNGSKIYYDSYQGASFPIPEDGNIPSAPGVIPADPAKSDCNKDKPGGQLIFGGESHVYAADGSLEVCAGPNPDDPSGSLAIGIYGVPAVAPLRPSSAAWAGGDAVDTSPDPNDARRIGDPDGGANNNATKVLHLRYNESCATWANAGFCDQVQEARVNLTFPGIGSVPAKYEIGAAKLRVAYHPMNADSCSIANWIDNDVISSIIAFFAGCTSPEMRKASGSAWPMTMPTQGKSFGMVSINDYLGSGNDAIDQLRSLHPSPGRVSDGELQSGFTMQWAARGRMVCGAGICGPRFDDWLDGAEVDVAITPKAPYANVPMLRPQSGCITAMPNYDRGEGTPDCALVRVDSYNPDDSNDKGLCFGDCAARRANWFGRVSVKGTIYAPSSAVEIDDNDLGYPLATRGAILRHLRLSGSRERSNYLDPSIGGDLDRTPKDRQAVLTACIQNESRRSANEACDASAGDRVLARSGLLFTVDPRGSATYRKAVVPKVQWYSDEVTHR